MAACTSWISTPSAPTQVLDWNTMSIDWQGRGWDRGLRGIAFDGEVVYIAASDELFAWTSDFRLIGSWRNKYLKHCHEIHRHERTLFLTSTGFDSILGFDLDRKSFSWGLHVTAQETGFAGAPFDPEFDDGPPPSNRLHLNNVHCERGGMHISGLRTGGMLLFNGRAVQRWVTLPVGVHNAQPYEDGVLFNDTAADVVRFVSRAGERVLPVPRFSASSTHAYGRRRWAACAARRSHAACASSKMAWSPAALHLPPLLCIASQTARSREWRH